MNKITIDNVLSLAEQYFPKAPEKLTELLGIEVRYSPLDCDGWCLQLNDRSLIRINNDIPKARQRFTLAHELGHLILGVPSLIGEAMLETSTTISREEKQVDKFASEFLLPEAIVKSEFRELPITATKLKRFAKRAKVSDLVVARRIASLAEELGLKKASVLFFKNDKLNRQFSETLEIENSFAKELLEKCVEVAPKSVRIAYEQDSVIVASSLENLSSNTKIIFLQIVNDIIGFKHLREEKVIELARNIFQDDTQFRNVLNGRFGGFKKIAKDMLLEEAIQLFNERLITYPDALTDEHLEILASEEGQEFIRLKLQY